MQRICCDNIPEIMKYEDVFLRLFPIRMQYDISENVIMIDADDPSVVDLAHTLLIHLMSCITEEESLTDDLIYSVYDAMMSSHKNSTIVKTFTGKPIRPKTENQEKYVHSIRTKLITFCEGPAGSSKTFLAIASACRALRKKEIRKIIITRPVVEAGESLGFLPGDLMEKIDPYLQPLYDSLHDILGKPTVEKYIADGTIQVAPLAYMRGVTFSDSFVILDEAQNATRSQLKMFLTRFGTNSRMVVEGDPDQVDLKGADSCLHDISLFKNIRDIGIVHFTNDDIVRHPLVTQIIKAYQKTY